MQLLVIKGDSYHLVDLDKSKPLSLREVVRAVEDQIMIVDTEQLDETSLDDLLMSGLRNKAPEPAPTATRVKAPTTDKPKEDLATMRAWLREQGETVRDNGRIAADKKDKYYAAHPDIARP
jgi:hypothetical protein